MYNNVTGGSPSFKVTKTGNVIIPSLAGNYSNNEAFVCVNNNGKIFASENPCSGFEVQFTN